MVVMDYNTFLSSRKCVAQGNVLVSVGAVVDDLISYQIGVVGLVSEPLWPGIVVWSALAKILYLLREKRRLNMP